MKTLSRGSRISVLLLATGLIVASAKGVLADGLAEFKAALAGDWVSVEETPYIELGLTIPIYQMLRFGDDGGFISAFYAPAWPYATGVLMLLSPFAYGYGEDPSILTGESLLHDPPLRVRGRYKLIERGGAIEIHLSVQHASGVTADEFEVTRPALVLDGDGATGVRLDQAQLVVDDAEGTPHRFRAVDWELLSASRSLLETVGVSAGQWSRCAEEATGRLLAGEIPAGAAALAGDVDLVVLFQDILVLENSLTGMFREALLAAPPIESLVADRAALTEFAESLGVTRSEHLVANQEQVLSASDRLRQLFGSFVPILTELCPDGRVEDFAHMCRMGEDSPDLSMVKYRESDAGDLAELAEYWSSRTLCDCIAERMVADHGTAAVGDALIAMAAEYRAHAGFDSLGLGQAEIVPLFESCAAETAR